MQRKDFNSYLFCDNSPTIKYDPYGLLSEDDCEQAYQNDMKKVRQAGAKCLASAVKWGIIGEVVFGAAGTAGGAYVGGGEGAGIGLLLGTGADVIVDYCHWNHCNKEVEKMQKTADDAHADCLKKVNQ